MYSISVHIGQHISSGQVLVDLTSPVLDHARDEARAQLNLAQARLAEAREQKRDAGLSLARHQRAAGVFSQQELAALQHKVTLMASQLKQALAQQAVAQAQWATAQFRLQQTQVRAPFDGVISARYVDPGTQVNPGTPLLRVVSQGVPSVRFAVPPQRAARLHIGEAVCVTSGEAPVSFTARIRHVAPNVDIPSQQVFVEASFDSDATRHTAAIAVGNEATVRLAIPQPGGGDDALARH